jgi:hypothetical protein
MASQRIYLVVQPDGTPRLVKASIRSQALSHVASTLLTIHVATQDDLVDLLSNGVKVESARSPDQMEIEA